MFFFGNNFPQNYPELEQYLLTYHAPEEKKAQKSLRVRDRSVAFQDQDNVSRANTHSARQLLDERHELGVVKKVLFLKIRNRRLYLLF